MRFEPSASLLKVTVGDARGDGLVDGGIESLSVDVGDREPVHLLGDGVLDEGDFLVDLDADGADELHVDAEFLARRRGHRP